VEKETNTRYAQALTRSLLLALGLDHVLIDLLACSIVGAAKVLLAILFVPIRVPRGSAHLAKPFGPEL